jgi:hypothetical protein
MIYAILIRKIIKGLYHHLVSVSAKWIATRACAWGAIGHWTKLSTGALRRNQKNSLSGKRLNVDARQRNQFASLDLTIKHNH